MFDSKSALMESTIKLIAEEGLQGFSMKRVTQMAGTSETLIYRHFETKDGLLLRCFQSVDRQISAHFARHMLREDFAPDPKLATTQDREMACRRFLLGSLRFLADLGTKTLYYREYLNHKSIQGETARGMDLRLDRLKAFPVFSDALTMAAGLDLDRGSLLYAHLFYLLLFYSSAFIRDEIPSNLETCEEIWKLLWGGMLQAVVSATEEIIEEEDEDLA